MLRSQNDYKLLHELQQISDCWLPGGRQKTSGDVEKVSENKIIDSQRCCCRTQAVETELSRASRYKESRCAIMETIEVKDRLESRQINGQQVQMDNV